MFSENRHFQIVDSASLKREFGHHQNEQYNA